MSRHNAITPTGLPGSGDPNSMESLARLMRQRCWELLSKAQGEIGRDQIESVASMARAPGPTAPSEDHSSKVAKSSPAPTPPAAQTSGVPQDVSVGAEVERLRSRCAQLESRKEQYKQQVQRLTDDRDRARWQPVESLGIESLLGKGDASDNEVIVFAIEAEAAGELLSSWGRARFVGQLATDLESLPLMLAQTVSSSFYRLVQKLRDQHRVTLYQVDAQKAGDAVARFLMGKSAGALADGVRALPEGMAFDGTVCMLQDSAMSLGPSGKVVPRTFVIGQPGSRLFRKAIVVPDPTGDASA